MIFNPPPNKIIVKIDKGKRFNDEREGLTIDTSYNPLHHVKISAEVVGVPICFDGGVITALYEGQPHPIPKGNKNINSLYDFVYKFLTVKDFGLDIKVKDKIYFKYLAIGVDMFDKTSYSYLLSDDDGNEYHKISTDILICTVRENKIIPLLGNVLVHYIEEDVMRNGLIVAKKDDRKHLRGVIYKIAENTKLNLKDGDNILFHPKSEFENNIEGVNVYVMKEWFVMAKEVNNTYAPIGKYVKIKMIDRTVLQKKSKDLILSGVVVSKGEDCVYSNIGDMVAFVRSSFYTEQDDDIAFIREEDIIYQYADIKEN